MRGINLVMPVCHRISLDCKAKCFKRSLLLLLAYIGGLFPPAEYPRAHVCSTLTTMEVLLN